MKVREERNPWLHFGKHRRCTYSDHLLRASPQSPEAERSDIQGSDPK